MWVGEHWQHQQQYYSYPAPAPASAPAPAFISSTSRISSNSYRSSAKATCLSYFEHGDASCGAAVML
jgi:hypothetical protein